MENAGTGAGEGLSGGVGGSGLASTGASQHATGRLRALILPPSCSLSVQSKTRFVFGKHVDNMSGAFAAKWVAVVGRRG